MIAYGNLFANWMVEFPFSLLKSQRLCVHHIIEIYSGKRANWQEKNPKAVYFVVIVTMDSFFFLRCRFRFFFQSIRDYTFDVNFICVTMYIYQLTVLFAFCDVTIEIRARQQQQQKDPYTYSQTKRHSESEKNGVSLFFLHSSNFILIYLLFAK